MQKSFQLSITAFLVLRPVLHLQVHDLHPAKTTILIAATTCPVLPSLLQPNSEHLPLRRVSCITAQAEAVDLVTKLNSVCGVDVPGTKIPQVDPKFDLDY